MKNHKSTKQNQNMSVYFKYPKGFDRQLGPHTYTYLRVQIAQLHKVTMGTIAALEKRSSLWSQMDEFLTSRFQVLERVEMKFPKSVCKTSDLTESHNEAKAFKTSSKLVFSCYLCSTPHPMKKCQVFKNSQLKSA